MSFMLDPEHEALQARVSEFAAGHLSAQRVAELERGDAYPDGLHAAMADAGLLGTCIPEPLGGRGGRALAAVVVTEALARHSATAVNMFLVNTVFAGTALQLAGTGAQRKRFLPALASGELRFAFALTEPGAGSDAGGLETAARPGDDGWRVTGVKLYTTGAEAADYLLVVALTDPEARAQRGSSVLLVPREASGVSIRPLEKIAGNAMSSCEVRFDDALVPNELLLGGEAGVNRAWGMLAVMGGMERVCVAASCVGLAQTIYEHARAHALERVQFGQPVARFQAIQHKLVDMATSIEAMRLMSYSAAARADAGHMAAKEMAMAKCFASERIAEIALDGMKILGGAAYLESQPMARYLREGLLSFYAGGTNEIQRNLIARFLEL